MFVLVPKCVIAKIQSSRTRYHPHETGGFLIGLRRGPHIEVIDLTLQAEGDIANHTSFERVAPMHRERIHAAWRASNETATLVGDWHSHPYGAGAPSSTDGGAWRALLRNLRQPVLGLIDVGAALPKIYLAAEERVPFATALRMFEEGPDHLAFAPPVNGA